MADISEAIRGIPGIHHVTAITADPQRNLDFYTGVLGLRLVKLTVNFDDPGSYHFYLGDELGRPGTILTFFAWPGAPRGRQGTGQTAVTAFAIPHATLSFWLGRLTQHGVRYEIPHARFDEQVVAFKDPDGLLLELVADREAAARPGWDGGPVPPEQAIRGFHSVTLWEEGYERTAELLTETMGLRLVANEENTYRYAAEGDEGPGILVDVRCAPGLWRGRVAAGTVHHVAWRTSDDAAQLGWRERLVALGLNVTPVIDRTYFHSIYFREPGGVLFEIATLPPGFTVDEPADALGTSLKLPLWLEPERAEIERVLPPMRLPDGRQSPPAVENINVQVDTSGGAAS
jgi:catechol 2,3-dioxygenase-like lactoylglutathione lyase family enzyme